MLNLQNPNLRTLAIMSAQLTKNLESPSDYLIPFFEFASRKNHEKPATVGEIRNIIQEEFSLEIPIYLCESILYKLNQRGFLVYNKELKTYSFKDNSIPEFEQENLDSKDFETLELRLKSFAQEKYQLSAPLNSKDWPQAIIKFFAENEDGKKIANIRGVLVSNAEDIDNRVVANFINTSEASDEKVFNLIKKIYTAYAIADTISSIQCIGHKENWNTLNVVYDTTVLMRLLGTSGKFLRDATLELHSLLKDVGCKTYYFNHNIAEIYQILESISLSISNGHNFHNETKAALENGDITREYISILRGSADIELAKLNIFELELPERMSNTKGQIDPVYFENYLKSRINYRRNNNAALIDASSIENILFLRKSLKYTDIPKAGYIFVTNNNQFAKATTSFCITNCSYSDRNVPAAITINHLTRIAWLASNNGGERIDISADLMINCYKASLPDDRWYEKFWETIKNEDPNLLDKDIQESLYLIDLRRIAEDETLGTSVLLEKVDFKSILIRAKEASEERESRFNKEITEAQGKNEALKAELVAQNKNYLDKIENEKLLARQEKELELNKKSREAIEQAEQAKKLAERNLIQELARTHSIYAGKIISILLGLIFSALFVYSLLTDRESTLLYYSLLLINLFLTSVQIIGLFRRNSNFYFIGSKIEHYLYPRLLKRYISSITKS